MNTKHGMFIINLGLIIQILLSSSLLDPRSNTGESRNSANNFAGANMISLDAHHMIFLPAVMHGLPVESCLPLFYDDFSDPGSGWPIETIEYGLYEYVDGEYRIQISNPIWWSGARPDFSGSDFRINVQVRNVNAVDGSFGLVFGLSRNWEEMYTFEINSFGYFGLFRYGDETWFTLAEGYDPSLNLGTSPNQIAIVRDGASIYAFANGNLLASVSDSSYMGVGYVGLIITNYDQVNLDVRFDNFEVLPVDC